MKKFRIFLSFLILFVTTAFAFQNCAPVGFEAVPAVGARAPDFELVSLDGSTVSLSQYGGKKILIALLRNAQCAICNLWVANITKHALVWRDQGLEIVAIFESSSHKLKEQFAGRTPPFAILADADGIIHERFGSRNDAQRVHEVVAKGLAESALKNAAASGFTPKKEEGANFFRIPSELLIDEKGFIREIHHAYEVFDHMDVTVIEKFLAQN